EMPRVPRVYYDNNAVCGRVLGDLQPDDPAQMEALRLIEAAHDQGILKRVTSKQSQIEQRRTQDPAKRATLEEAWGQLSAVPNDHRLLGINHLEGRYGTIANSPILTDIVDEALYNDLMSLGLKDADAKHLMYAAEPGNSCDYFITTDP